MQERLRQARRLKRRDFMSLTAGAAALTPRIVRAAAAQPAPRPFQVNIPQQKIERILARVRDAEWPERMDVQDLRYGVSFDYMSDLAKYWLKDFDWRKAEARLNQYPQFMARIGEHDIHFYHIKGRGPRPTPLILTHGWPGSVVEFLDAMGPLSDPAAHGGSAEDAFDVVVPSLPGFGFSSHPAKPLGRPGTAALWDRLMREVLGYGRYISQGGDIGAHVTVQLAHHHPKSLLGIHLNGAPENGIAPPEAQQSEEEKAWRKRLATYSLTESDYINLQTNKPQTVAFALTGNPLGAAAWMVEKLKAWSDSGRGPEPVFTKDQVLTDLMLYFVTDTITSSMVMYRARIDDPNAVGRVEVPTGRAALPAESPSMDPPRSVLERNYNLVHYTKLDRGGHFAFWEQPDLMVKDVRAFARKLRG